MEQFHVNREFPNRGGAEPPLNRPEGTYEYIGNFAAILITTESIFL